MEWFSLAALRWLADQDAAFVMLERDGHVLATTGPVRSSDARLRRAQALAEHSGAALCIARELISRKLVGQERVARDILLDSTTADVIGRLQAELDKLKPWTRSGGWSPEGLRLTGRCGVICRSASPRVICIASPITGEPSTLASPYYQDLSGSLPTRSMQF